MDDIISSLIVIAVTAVVVGLIFWLVARKNRQREAALRQLASLNGWVYEPIKEQYRKGYRLSKGAWNIEAVNTTTSNSPENTGSSTVTSETRWFNNEARLSNGMLLIGPRQPEINLGNVSGFLMQAALQLMIGDEAQDAKGIESIELGSLELMKRYMVWTNQPETAKEFLNMHVESALLNWPPKKVPPVIKYSPRGLEVKVQGQRLSTAEDLTALVKLGNVLLDAAA